MSMKCRTPKARKGSAPTRVSRTLFLIASPVPPHHRHEIVGGSLKDRLRSMRSKDVAHRTGDADVRNAGPPSRAQPQLLVDLPDAPANVEDVRGIEGGDALHEGQHPP